MLLRSLVHSSISPLFLKHDKRSARLGLHSRDRYRDYDFLSLKYETETQNFGISRLRLWQDFFLAFFRPRLNFSYFGDRDLNESQNRDYAKPRLFHNYNIFLLRQICPVCWQLRLISTLNNQPGWIFFRPSMTLISKAKLLVSMDRL